MSTSKITSAVDSEIKDKYDATFERGKVTYKEMVEEGMLRRIEEFDPIEACKLRIDRYNKLLNEETKKLDNLLNLEARNKSTQASFTLELEKKRIEKFESKKDIYATQINNQSQDWGKIATALWLDNANEAKAYVIPKLIEVGLIE